MPSEEKPKCFNAVRNRRRASVGRAYRQTNQEYSFVSFRKVEFDVWEMMGRTKDTSAAKKKPLPFGGRSKMRTVFIVVFLFAKTRRRNKTIRNSQSGTKMRNVAKM